MKLKHSRSALLALLSVLAVACALTGLALASPSSHSSSLTSFQNAFVSFRYPATWSSKVWTEQVPHFDPMVYVSTASTQHDPCRTSTAGGTTIVCGWPIARLAPNALLVKWENRDFPGVTVSTFPGTKVSVDGRPGRLTIRRPGSCGSTGADETISVAVARSSVGSWTQIDACLRGPHLAALAQQFHAMLATTRFLAP